MNKARRWTNTDLREVFDTYNDAYFDGKLECNHITFADMYPLGKTTRLRAPGKRRSEKDLFSIKINKNLRHSRRLWATTLLHEMVHLEQRNRYSCGLRGRRFNARMVELAVTGAFDGIW